MLCAKRKQSFSPGFVAGGWGIPGSGAEYALDLSEACLYEICITYLDEEALVGGDIQVFDASDLNNPVVNGSFINGQKCFTFDATNFHSIVIRITAPERGSLRIDDLTVEAQCEHFTHYAAQVESSQDYYPFGSVMPGRNYTARGYRYGFNGKESDDEVSGEGNQYDYGFRIYNPRLGRFLSVDPLTKDYPNLTSYQFSANSPIKFSDIDGAEMYVKGIMAEEYVNLLALRSGLELTRDATGMLSYTSIQSVVTLKSIMGSEVAPGKELILSVPKVNSNSDGSFQSNNLRQLLIDIIDKKANSVNVNAIIDNAGGPFDSYDNATVDVYDLQNLQSEPVFQAATIGHFLKELEAGGGFEHGHSKGIAFETNIIKEAFPNAALRNESAMLDRIGMPTEKRDIVTALAYDYSSVIFVTKSKEGRVTNTGAVGINAGSVEGVLKIEKPSNQNEQ